MDQHLGEGNDNPITFCSLISFSLDEDPKMFIYNEGFLDCESRITNMVGLTGNRNTDFLNCVFKILPFSTKPNMIEKIISKESLAKIDKTHG